MTDSADPDPRTTTELREMSCSECGAVLFATTEPFTCPDCGLRF